MQFVVSRPAAAVVCAAVYACFAAEPVQLPTIDVIGTTPLPGVDRPLEQVPANAQSATSRDIDRSNARDLTDS